MERYGLKYFISFFISSIIIICFAIAVNYTGTEGFNPSDDGVVIAQSYRIFNGEIPHKDFISIRPVGSGLLHIIHLILPLPLMHSMRFFIIIQSLIIAMLMAIVIKEIYNDEFKADIPLPSILGVLLLGFILTLLDYNMFPWTTIDAIFWSMMAFALLMSKHNHRLFINILALLFVSMAALSRQTFVLIAAVLFLHVFLINLRNNKIFRAFVLMIIGSLPISGYLFFLYYHQALTDFFSQMTGRTELIETGFIQYGKYLLHSPSIALHIAVGLLFVASSVWRKSNNKLQSLIKNKAYIFSIIILVYAYFSISYHFLDNVQDIYRMPFEMFWLLIDMILLSWISIKLMSKTYYVSVFVLILAWTSSVSLGDNSPVFASGILASMILYLGISIIKLNIKTDIVLPVKIIGIAMILILTVFSFYGQKKWNYRDLPARQLQYKLLDANPNFGKTLTNNTTGAYYKELSELYYSLPNAKDHIMVLPNNAMFYPMFNTLNLLPLDWMQPAEYVGQEDRVNKSVSDLCQKEGYYFVIDKIESKNMAFEIKQLNFDSYPYMDIIFTYCSPISIDSDYFVLYKSVEKNLQ